MNNHMFNLDKAVSLIFKSHRYQPNQTWTDSITQFKSYTHLQSKTNTFFKIISLPSTYTFIPQSYHRIFTLLHPYIIHTQLYLVQRQFQHNYYLLQNQKNSLILSQYINIKNQNSQQIDPRFILKLLNFFMELLKIIMQYRINIDLTLNTICIQQDEFKLCDYEIFFHPKNLKLKIQSFSKQKYIQQMQLILFQLLKLNANVQQDMGNSLQNSLITLRQSVLKNSKLYPDTFTKIIYIIFQKCYLPEKLIIQQSKRLIYQCGYYHQEILTDSYISFKQSFSNQSQQHDSQIKQSSLINSETNITINVQKKNHKLSKKKVCFIGFFIILLLAAMVLVICKFLFIDNVQCKSNEFKIKNKCYPCYQGCTNCLGEGSNQCTKCWGSYWLVVLNDSEKSGSCSDRCFGIQFEGRKCIVKPHSLNEQ